METQEGYLDPKCPRCGYDQSGEAATWDEACPVEGTCPECGHGFGWADLYDPSRQDDAWLIEHGTWFFVPCGRILKIPARIALPWRFWNRIRVDARTRTLALFAWVVFASILLHLLVSSVHFVFDVNRYGGGFVFNISNMDRFELLVEAINSTLWPIGQVSYWRTFYFDWGSAHWYEDLGMRDLAARTIGIGFGWLLLLAVIPTTRRLTKIKSAHVARAAYYYILGAVIWAECYRLLAIFFVDGISVSRGYQQLLLKPVGLLFLCWTYLWWISAIRLGWSIRSLLLIVLGTFLAYLVGRFCMDIEYVLGIVTGG